MKRIPQLIEKNATDFRLQFGLGTIDSLNLESLLLKLRVSSYFRPLSEKFSGMALKTEEDRFMLVNTSQSIGRQNFTICHEIYHLFIQEDFSTETTYKVAQFDKKDLNEYKADLFASYLLMPYDGILAVIPKVEMETEVSLDTVVRLEQFFQVSRRAMLYRLKQMGLITSSLYDRYCTDVIKSAIRRGFKEDLYRPTHQTDFISNYGDLANHLVESRKISEGDYFSLMMDIGIDVLDDDFENDVQD